LFLSTAVSYAAINARSNGKIKRAKINGKADACRCFAFALWALQQHMPPIQL